MKSIQQLEISMINLVNTEREKRGLKPFRSSQMLCEVARQHSQVQLRKKDIFHKSPVDGSVHADRIKQSDYLAKCSAENVSTAPTLEMSHTGLMNSPGHYKNIVGAYEEIGIGISKDICGQLYVTQIFASPVRMIDPGIQKARILEGVYHYRKHNQLNTLKHISLECIQRFVAGVQILPLDALLEKAFDEIQLLGTVYQQAQIFSFEGFENPNPEKQLQLIKTPGLLAISIGLHQDKKTGMMKAVFLFLS